MLRERAVFIVNPASGRGRGAATWRRLEPLVRGSFSEPEVHFTGGRMEAARMAEEAARGGVGLVVAVGGDGTISEIVHGVASARHVVQGFASVASGASATSAGHAAHGIASGASAAHPDPSAGRGPDLAIIPAGTGNDWAEVVGVPRHPERALRVAAGGAVREVDLPFVEPISSQDSPPRGRRRYFINAAGVGFDAAVARLVNSLPKRLGGTLPYIAGVIRALASYRPRPLRIVADGQEIVDTCLLVVAGNGWRLGGGMRLTPHAKPDDGLFDVVIGGNLSVPATLAVLPRLYPGTHLSHPLIRLVRACSLTVEALDEAVTYCQVDGEDAGTVPVRLSVLPRALRFRAPATSASSVD